MNILYGGRASGKTTELIKRSAEDGGHIVCISTRACRCVFEQAKEMKLNIPFPITYDELVDGEIFPGRAKSFHIDNVEYLLRHICRGVQLKTITFTPFGSITRLEIPEQVRKEFEKYLW